jgi:two-component sensor histidine kinase
MAGHMIANLHPEEPARLASLRRYGILDTAREDGFDEIVELAAAICETPVAQINFIDANRQWSKAEIGVGVCEISLEVSICAHAILGEDFVEIPDMLKDARTADNPACLSGPKVRYYAGVQLKSKSGLPIGTLCVIDIKPRSLTAIQREALRVLASQVVALLEVRAALASATLLRSEMDHRVKNSLQTISSFVNLERLFSNNEHAKSALQSVEQQINSVALIHDLLSKSVDDENIALAQYLSSIVELLDRVTPRHISVSGDFVDVTVSAQFAGLTGLIVNELVANAVKHSFGIHPGTIVIAGEWVNNLDYRITCDDDGQASHDLAGQLASNDKRDGLGLEIIDASVKQLNGNMTISMTDTGYQTTFEFTPSAI